MRAKELITKLQQVDPEMEITLSCCDVPGDSVAQIGRSGVRRVYDNNTKNGDRQVFNLEMMDYGYDEYELITTPN